MKFLTSDWLFNSNDAQVIDHVFYGRVPYLTSEELENYPLDAEFRIQQLLMNDNNYPLVDRTRLQCQVRFQIL